MDTEFPDPRQHVSGPCKAKFHDFNDEATFHSLRQQAVDAAALNFVVGFGKEKAQIALDLNDEELADFLQSRDPECPVRWVNVWDPSQQPQAVNEIGKHYSFSPRLVGSLVVRYPESSHESSSAYTAREKRRSRMSVPPPSNKDHDVLDLEATDNGTEPRHRQRSMPQDMALEETMALQLIQGILNYTSIDQGEKFICMGANWLHKPPHLPREETRMGPNVNLPRHWSWFVLGHDGTVVSFHEKPRYDLCATAQPTDKDGWRRQELENMRSNTYKVLSQVSKCGQDEFRRGFLNVAAIRESLWQETVGDDVHSESERALSAGELEGVFGSSSLFYYLFEDYSATFIILQHYKDVFEKLTSHILESSGWNSKVRTADITRDLHMLSKELRQLKHLFSGYKKLIDRLAVDTAPKSTQQYINLTKHAKLSHVARDRFGRLGDRIQMLVLNTIQEYIEEKNTLSNTYFNIIAQRDSQAVARLSRSATLLAKLTVFFLPISFMSSYFSISIPNAMDGYTVGTYWDAFAGVASVSFILLFFFSRLLMLCSDMMDRLLDGLLVWYSRSFSR